jgi:hypothetical protein
MAVSVAGAGGVSSLASRAACQWSGRRSSSCRAGVAGKRVSTSCRYAHGSTPSRWHVDVKPKNTGAVRPPAADRPLIGFSCAGDPLQLGLGRVVLDGLEPRLGRPHQPRPSCSVVPERFANRCRQPPAMSSSRTGRGEWRQHQSSANWFRKRRNRFAVYRPTRAGDRRVEIVFRKKNLEHGAWATLIPARAPVGRTRRINVRPSRGPEPSPPSDLHCPFRQPNEFS